MPRTGLVTALLPPSLGGTEILVWRLFRDAPDTVVVSGAAGPPPAPPRDDPYQALDTPTLSLPYPRLRGYRYGLGAFLGGFAAVWLAWAVERAVRFLRRQGVSQIVSIPHNGPFALVGLFAARRLRVPHTFYILDAWEDAGTGPLERRFIHHGLRLAARTPRSRLAAVSPALAAHYRDAYGFADCVWIPNPAPLPVELPATEVSPQPIAVMSGGIKPFNVNAVNAVVRAMRHCTIAQKLVVTGPAFRHAETLRAAGELHDRVEFRLASRTEVAELQRQAAVLVIANNVGDTTVTSLGYLPGRLPEYVAARRPILIVGPEGSEASRAVRHWELGSTLATLNEVRIASELDALTAAAIRPTPAPSQTPADLFLEVFSRAEARRRLLGEPLPPPSPAAEALAERFDAMLSRVDPGPR